MPVFSVRKQRFIDCINREYLKKDQGKKALDGRGPEENGDRFIYKAWGRRFDKRTECYQRKNNFIS
jgi:hypothetical protein